jgi:hypothetical protein
VTRRAGRSLLPLAVAGVAWFAAACLDISSPVSGIASITVVMPPTPSVVEHDTSRDTAGVAKPLKVYAIAPNGDTVSDILVRFFAFDTTGKLRVDSVTGLAVGDSLSPNAKVFARVTPANGKGILTTPLSPLPVVPVPLAVAKDTDIVFNFSNTVADTLSSSLISAPLGVTVKGNGDTTVQSYLVKYELVRSPTSAHGDTTVVLVNASGRDSSWAATGVGGRATRQLRIRRTAIEPELLVGTKTDTVIVKVHVLFRGDTLRVTPADSFVVPVHAAPTP